MEAIYITAKIMVVIVMITLSRGRRCDAVFWSQVESIEDMKQSQGKRQFKIRWKGYGPDNDTWENEEDLNCPNIIKSFLEKNKAERSNESKTEKYTGKGANNRSPKKTKTEEGKGNEGENNDREYEVSI
jgi:hypothetical protein